MIVNEEVDFLNFFFLSTQKWQNKANGNTLHMHIAVAKNLAC